MRYNSKYNYNILGFPNLTNFAMFKDQFDLVVQILLLLAQLTGCLRSSGLTLATLFGVIGGVIFGLALRTREQPWTDRSAMLPGTDIRVVLTVPLGYLNLGPTGNK